MLHRAGRRAARRFLDAHFDDIGVRGTIERGRQGGGRRGVIDWRAWPRRRPTISSAHRRGRRRAARDRRRRHHHARRRRHRQRREPLAARRRRGRRRDPSRRGAGAAGGMPHARRLRHRLGQDHPRLSPEGQARHPRGRPGVERRRQGEEDLLASCYRTALDARRRARPALDRIPGDLDRRLSLSRRSRGAHRGRHGACPRRVGAPRAASSASVFCCFSQESAEHHMRMRSPSSALDCA